MKQDADVPTPDLVRELGWLDATMIVMGSMIGSGIFITSAQSARLTGAPGWLLAAWAVSGLLTITTPLADIQWSSGQMPLTSCSFDPASFIST